MLYILLHLSICSEMDGLDMYIGMPVSGSLLLGVVIERRQARALGHRRLQDLASHQR